MDMVSKVVKARHRTSPVYVTSTPLVISAACPYSDKSAGCVNLGSSKTIDLPVPREWGLPPTSYYTPFIPIIGIP
ncbi:hypothetical protein MLD38_003456 [Melastoma candidum]|uniref:Uncharacterized protein n=1 Tax=Melastoma candidum TaxID=119954 RepID=A0ACB9S6H9_9MYRT|nr:hypothetical protein MLD38_003456 [Melastoma candidum]